MTSSSRREFLKTGGLALAGFGLSGRRAPLFQERAAFELIEMRSDAAGSQVWFDPVGLFVEAGTTVRWIARENVHTTAAYHPKNEHHSLRIPEAAKPWDSGFLIHPGDHFEVTLVVPGVYDYYCLPHEAAGMVGRIVVGKALGPGTQPFDYWVGESGTADWVHVPDAARDAFPDIASILMKRRVHAVGPRS